MLHGYTVHHSIPAAYIILQTGLDPWTEYTVVFMDAITLTNHTTVQEYIWYEWLFLVTPSKSYALIILSISYLHG